MREDPIRPFPPEMEASFLPAPELESWARATFIAAGGPLENEDHQHLQSAKLGFLWSFVEAKRGGRRLAGQTEIMPPMAMGAWQRKRAAQQVSEWFGECPDFLITIDAEVATLMDDASFCALVEHELYHAGHERAEFDAPRFHQDGSPVFAIRAHDIEEFRGVVRRYGAAVTDLAGLDLSARPEVGPALIRSVCGTCLRAVK